MQVTNKTLYALRALFELARHRTVGPIKAADIARAQSIPLRFLETILAELRQAGFVTSRRGAQGGYQLAREPQALTVGEVISFTEGPPSTTPGEAGDRMPLAADFVFQPLWQQVSEAVAGVMNTTSFQDLLDWEAERAAGEQPIAYVI